MKVSLRPIGLRFHCSLLLYGLVLMAPAFNKSSSAAPGRLPMVSAISEIVFLDDAKNSCARADDLKSSGQPAGAIQEYEDLIKRSVNLPASLMHSYEFYTVIAGAHLDAALLRTKSGARLETSLNLTEQNHARIEGHLAAVPGLAFLAAKAATGAPDERRQLFCQTQKLLASGLFLRGTFDRSSKDLLQAIETYKAIANCDPPAAANAREMIAYAKSVEADISKPLLGADNLEKVMSKFVSIGVPKAGSYLSVVIDICYESYKQRKQSSVPLAPR